MWNKEVFRNVFQKKARLQARILGIQKSLASRSSELLVKLDRELRGEYQRILKEEREL